MWFSILLSHGFKAKTMSEKLPMIIVRNMLSGFYKVWKQKQAPKLHIYFSC